MNYNKSALAVAVAATLGGASTAANAVTYFATLTSVTTYSNNGSSVGDLSSSTATFSYNDVTNLLTQTGGTYNVRLSIVPNVVTLFRHLITGLVIGNGAPASATTYVCQSGNFGGITGANLCGNYNFGVNFIDESTLSYGPGTAVARTIGGDDVIIGAPQAIDQDNGFTTTSFSFPNVTVSNAGAGPGTGPLPNIGYTWTLTLDTVDTDGDLVGDSTDNCPAVANSGQADTDGDLRGNACDNCRNVANNTGAGAQADSDGDGFGNRCDGDFNQNNVTNSQDYILFRQQLGQPSVPPTYNSRDINANGAVNSQDYILFRGLLGSAPGPGAGP